MQRESFNRVMIYLLIILGVIALDRVTKMWLLSGYTVGETTAVLGDFFHITYVQNRGVAFSMLMGHETIILAATSALLVAAVVFLLIARRKFSPLFNTGLALVCGGGLGNVIDRAAYGYVVDMFDFGWFPVFNVADICICTGCGLMLLYVLRSMKDDNGAAE